MNLGAEITEEALCAGLVLSRNGAKIHIESPLGRPLTEELRRRLVEHKAEVLAWLDFCERADVMLLAVSARIAARQPDGCPLDGATWRAANLRLRAAHHSEHLPTYCAALLEYERFANERFSLYQAQQRDKR